MPQSFCTCEGRTGDWKRQGCQKHQSPLAVFCLVAAAEQCNILMNPHHEYPVFKVQGSIVYRCRTYKRQFDAEGLSSQTQLLGAWWFQNSIDETIFKRRLGSEIPAKQTQKGS